MTQALRMILIVCITFGSMFLGVILTIKPRQRS